MSSDRGAGGEEKTESGVLYLVSTPIGNLGDMTPRAAETLRAVDVVLCEDTRHSRILLKHLSVTTPVESLHEHNEAAKTTALLARLRKGAKMALISDAGTPTISDPGSRLVAAAVEAGIPVSPVPGPSAVIAAMSASGLGEGAFTFLGFLPRKGKERKEKIALVSELKHPSVLYEAAPRVSHTLQDLALQVGLRRALVARELTKHFEEFRRGTVAELAEYYRDREVRGEVVIVVEGGQSESAVDIAGARAAADRARREGKSNRDIVQELTSNFGLSRNEAYGIVHEGTREHDHGA